MTNISLHSSKIKLLLFLILLTTANLGYAKTLLVDKIKVCGKTKMAKDAVLYHIPIRENAYYDILSLQHKIENSKQRLIELGFFYKVEIYQIAKDTSVVKIIIELEDGFRPRIGGGTHPLFLGMNNLFNRGIFVGVEAGKNFVQLSAWQPISKFASLGFQACKSEEEIKNQNIDKIYYDIDLRIKLRDFYYLGSKAKLQNSESDNRTLEDNSFSINPYFCIDTRDKIIKTTKGNFFKSELKFKDASYDGINSEYFCYSQWAENFRNRTRLYSHFNKNTGKLTNYENNEGSKKFRSELNSQKYSLNSTLLSFDLFWDMSKFISPLIFVDGIKTWGSNFDDNTNKFAYGCGVEFYFQPPINVNVQFTYGRTDSENKIFFEFAYPIELDSRGL